VALLLNVVTWIWGDKYGEHYVRRLRDGVARNLKQPHRFIVVSDRLDRPLIAKQKIYWDRDEELRKIPGCLCRLRMFDRDWQYWAGFEEGDRIVSIDLDAVITGPLDDLFDRDEFTILSNVNTTNPCPYNGSVFMWRAGTHADVWTDFSLDAVKRVPFHAFPDDQGWFWHKIPKAREFGPATGVYGFKKKGWPSGDALPANAKIVAFPGWRDPEKFVHLDWIKEHWC